MIDILNFLSVASTINRYCETWDEKLFKDAIKGKRFLADVQ